jgi:hypothetical protein
VAPVQGREVTADPVHVSTGKANMAKALFGHVGLGPDVRVTTEMRRLRERVRDLEHEVARLEAANAALRNGLNVDDDMLTLSVPDGVSEQVEPALA